MQKITVLLAIQPRMLSEVVKRIVERQPDMEVVKEGNNIALRLATKATEAQVIILTPANPEEKSSKCHDLLGNHLLHLKIQFYLGEKSYDRETRHSYIQGIS